MNTSYNYADFIGMHIDSNINHEFQDEEPSHQRLPDNEKRIQPSYSNDNIIDDNTTE